MSSSDRDMQAKVVEKGVGILEKMRELLSSTERERSIPPVRAQPYKMIVTIVIMIINQIFIGSHIIYLIGNGTSL